VSDTKPAPPQKGRIGERLIRSGAITEAQLDLALREQARTGGRLGEIVVSLGFVTEEEVTQILASQAGVASVDLSGLRVPRQVIGRLDEEFCRRHRLIPIEATVDTIRVAMANSSSPIG